MHLLRAKVRPQRNNRNETDRDIPVRSLWLGDLGPRPSFRTMVDKYSGIEYLCKEKTAANGCRFYGFAQVWNQPLWGLSRSKATMPMRTRVSTQQQVNRRIIHLFLSAMMPS